MQSRSLRLQFALPFVVAVAVAGPCRAADPSDPLEGMNRRFFGVEEVLDRHLLGPLSRGFGALPSPFRTALRNFSRNLDEPVVFVNDMLQGRVKQATGTVARIVVNTTFGLGGVLDVAKKNHLPHHDNDFGMTLGRWGAEPGAYLFIPLIGPSTFRDAFGRAADIGLNPLTYARYPGKTEISIVTVIFDGLDARLDAEQELETILQTSTDPYATVRSYYLQSRQAEITGKAVDIESLPDFDTPSTASPASTPPGGRAPTSQPQPAAPMAPLSGEAGTPPQPGAPPGGPKAQATDQPPTQQPPP